MKKSSPKSPPQSNKPSREVYDLMFGAGQKQKKKAVQKEHWYLRLCKYSGKVLGKSAKKELTEDYKRALAFLGWKLKPEELNAAPLLVTYVGLALAFLNAILQFVFYSVIRMPLPTRELAIIGHPVTMDMGLVWYLGPFVLALFAMYYVQSFPMREVEKQKIRALGFIPEIVNYLVMAMKVTPNLERAIQFAAEHGHGKIAADFKELQYDIHVGKYKTVEEGLDNIAWKWGEYSAEFKHALMMIRSSIMEADEAKRNALLDKAISDVLEGIQEKMDMYSRAMHQPSIYLYYFGVLLPLLLIIVIPVGAMMGGDNIGWLASPWALGLIYIVLIPIASFLLAQSILAKRPPTREVPEIPEDLPGLPKQGWFKVMNYQLPVLAVCAVIFVAIVAASFALSPLVDPRPKSFESGYESYCLLQYPDAEAIEAGEQEMFCIPILQYAGFFIGAVSAFAFFIWSSAKDRRKVQKEIVRMEDEFQDTLYVLASRLGEGRPMEDALKHASDFLPDSLATQKIFMPTLQNIVMMGMTVKMALFDKAYGSLRFIPSPFIAGTMRIVVDSLDLGVQTAARSLISLSLQLRDAQKVEKALRAMLEDITSMMSTMCIFIAPVVLGITIALQAIIMGAMASMADTGIGDVGSSVGMMSSFSMPSIGGDIAGAASQADLLFIISVYMIEIVVILMWFASQVNEGKNPLAFRMALATALPIAMTVFFAVTFFAMKMTAIGI